MFPPTQLACNRLQYTPVASYWMFMTWSLLQELVIMLNLRVYRGAGEAPSITSYVPVKINHFTWSPHLIDNEIFKIKHFKSFLIEILSLKENLTIYQI